MNDTSSIYFDLGFLREENKILRDRVKDLEIRYSNLQKEYEETVKAYDNLVMDTLKRDLGEQL